MKDKIFEWVTHWFESTSTARKLADTFVAALIAVLVGGLYIAYQSESDLRRIAVGALSKMPTVDREAVRNEIDELYKTAQGMGARAVLIYEVDLSANMVSILAVKGEIKDQGRLGYWVDGIHKRPFIGGELGKTGSIALGAVMRGDKAIMHDPNDFPDTALLVPIPDTAGSFPAGIISVVWDGEVHENDSRVSQMKTVCSEYSGKFAR